MAQILVNTLVWGAELGLVALGISICYRVLRFANFAHVEFVGVGAIFAYWFVSGVGAPLTIAAVMAMVATGLFAMFLDRIVFSHVRATSEFAPMMASLGVGMAIRSLVQILGGAQVKSLTTSTFLQSGHYLLGARITDLQIVVILAAAASMVLLHGLLQYTKIGRAFRATANNPRLAEVRGVNVGAVVLFMWFLSGSFAALGGVLIGLETQVSPRMGWELLLPSFAAATLGGLGNMYGALAGGVAVALVENVVLAVDFGPLLGVGSMMVPTGFKPAISFLLIIIVLLFRPRGIFRGEE